ncbi:MAG: hypothetical protein V4580_17640 [Bacteroidota bacterium]
MRYCLYLLFSFITAFANAQGRYIPFIDTNEAFDTIPLTFRQKLNKFTDFGSKGISFEYRDLDTVNCKLSFDLEFLFSEKALLIFLKDLLNDSILKNISVSKKLSIKSNTLILKNKIAMNYLHTDSIINIHSINGTLLNKDLPIFVFLKKTRYDSPKFDLYIELSATEWYYFFYYKAVLSAVS